MSSKNETITQGPMFPRSAFGELSAIQKIQAIEYKRLPKDLDPTLEMVSSVAQFMHQRLSSLKEDPKSSEAFQSMVEFIDSADFMDLKIAKHKEKFGEDPNNDQIEKIRIMGAASYGGRVVISNSHLDHGRRDMEGKPDLVKQLNGRDAYAVFLKSTLIHEYLHEEETDEEVPFEDYSLTAENGVFDFNKMKGFEYFGKNRTTSSLVFIGGAREAAVEFAAFTIGAETGSYVSSSDDYSYGASFIRDLNKRAFIAETSMLRYLTGGLPLPNYLKGIGRLRNPRNPDTRVAQLALFTIGLRTEGLLTTDQTLGILQGFTNP